MLPLPYSLLAGKVAVPMLLPLVFLWAMYMRDAPKDADGNYLPPRPRRIVPRPGTQAWVDYNRALADHLRSKQLTGAEEQLAIEEASSSATTTATAEKPTIAVSRRCGPGAWLGVAAWGHARPRWLAPTFPSL